MKKEWKNKLLIALTLVLVVIVVFAFSVWNEKAKADKYIDIVFEMSEKYDVDGALILSIIKNESDFNKDAVSKKKAVGLMQLMENTAKSVADENGIIYNKSLLLDPRVNIELGTFYLKYLIEKFQNVDLAIIAYNAGEGNVVKWLENEKYSLNNQTIDTIPFAETEVYFNKVKKYRDGYSTYYESYATKKRVSNNATIKNV